MAMVFGRVDDAATHPTARMTLQLLPAGKAHMPLSWWDNRGFDLTPGNSTMDSLRFFNEETTWS